MNPDLRNSKTHKIMDAGIVSTIYDLKEYL